MIVNDTKHWDTSYISYVYEQEGLKPFNSYTDEELIAEYQELFNEEVKIVKGS